MQEYLPYISVGTLAALVVYAVRATWVIRNIDKEVRDDMDAHVENLTRDIAKLERDSASRIENLRLEAGEMGQALRTKIHDTETWNRDNFVRKDSFELIVGRLEKSIEKLGDKLEDKLERAFERMTRQD